MSNLFRTNAGRTAPVQPDTQLRIQSSVQGLPRPIGYGQTRTSGNLIWYGDFRAIAQQQQASGSGGKGSIFSTAGSSATNYIYQASVAIALSEGPITNVLQAFINNLSNTLAQLNLTLFNGSYSQSAWGYLTTVHPSQALNYRGISYVAAGPYQLGNTASLPNISFEVEFAINTGVSGVPDADPGACIIDFLTNPFYGVGFPPASVGPLTTYSNYCKATGMLISDCITQRAAASDWIKNLLKATNSDAVFSQGVLNIVPYGDQGYTAGTSYTITETHILSSIGVPGVPTISSITVGAPGNFISSGGVVYTTTNTPLTFVGSVPAITGAGLFTQSGSTYWFSTADGGQSITITYTYTAAASYSPPTNPIYALTDDDFLDTGATNTAGTAIQATRTRQSDQINNIKVEYFDRSNNYNPAVAEAMDDGSITLYGKRSGDTRQSHFFCTGTAAQQSANLELGRQYIRTTYKFTLGAKYILLDPMDVVSITDTALGLNQQWVRIKEIQENSDLTLTITAEEYLNGTGAAPLYSPSIPGGFNLNYNIQPGNVNAPIFIEPTIDLAGTLEIWLAISGSVPANWGGCEIWLSFDNSTYALIGIQSGPSRMGVLTGNLATLAGTGETQDNTNVLAVDLTESQSQLSSGTAQDMLEGITLCYVDGEFLSYEFAALNSAYHYSLNPLFRGLYNTWQVMNSVTYLTGSSFVRCDSGIFQYPYDPTKIGSTVYVKFLSFNPYGFGKQALSDVSPYTHTIVGVNQGITTVPGFSVSAITVTGSNGVSTPGILCNWTPIHNSTIVSVIVEYYPFVGGVGQSTQITFNDPASGAGTIAGLQALTLYEVRATIVTNPNTLPTSWTTYQAVTTPDTLVIHLGPDAAPDVPTGLTLSNIAAVTGSEGTVTGGISASWNNVTSPDIPSVLCTVVD